MTDDATLSETSEEATVHAAAVRALEPKFPLRGMPFDREALSKAAKRCLKAARRKGERIDWEEARNRGWTWLMQMHFPWFQPSKSK